MLIFILAWRFDKASTEGLRSEFPWQDSLTVYVPKVPAEGRGVGTLLSNTTSLIGKTIFKI